MFNPYIIAPVAFLVAVPALAQDSGSAVANFTSANGTEAGSVVLTQDASGVAIKGALTTVIPGEHGLHIYPIGDCKDASELRTRKAEGAEIAKVNADGQGNVAIDFTSDALSLTRGENQIVDDDGSALILDNGSDDPTVAATSSGEPVLCAVIEAKPAS
jgi:Cu-Zn family superoxide dismutase